MDAPETQCPAPLLMILWGEPDSRIPMTWSVLEGSRGLFSPLPKVAQCYFSENGRNTTHLRRREGDLKCLS